MSTDAVSEFKSVMQYLAATVSLVTTCEAGCYHGMPATAVASLSADPPSVLVCINRSASMHGPTGSNKRFCLNLLTVEQADSAMNLPRNPDPIASTSTPGRRGSMDYPI